MPKINLLPKKPKNNNRRLTDKRKLRQKAYGSTQWRKLRLSYLKKNPICQCCGKNASTDVHHLKSFIVGNEIDWNLLLDENNLMSLCKTCHGNIHSGKIKQEKQFFKDDDDGYNFFTL